MIQVKERVPTEVEAAPRIAVIDTDVHPGWAPQNPELLKHVPRRWREYLDVIGLRVGLERPRQRAHACRWDADPPGGGGPGTDPAFAAEQLLDRYDMTAAVLNDIGAFMVNNGKGMPAGLCTAFCRALNEHRLEAWLDSDPRWYASISVAHELPHEAAEEIRRCREESGEHNERWVQILLPPDNERPAGHQRYWPIYEAAEHYGIPVAFHVLASRKITPSGGPSFYFEEHCDFAGFNFPLVSSLVFEGVFDRFPGLRVALIELGWSWVVPFAWRMDHAYRVLRDEVGHLERLPSEYVRDHMWFSTQPMEEPEDPRHFDDLLRVLEEFGMGDKLMYSSDYPHWDFDAPTSLPRSVQLDTPRARRILGESASSLYGIPLARDRGVTFVGATG